MGTRKPITVLLSTSERAEIKAALATENAERAQALGLGSKLRELALLWARAHAKILPIVKTTPAQPARWRQPLAPAQHR